MYWLLECLLQASPDSYKTSVYSFAVCEQVWREHLDHCPHFHCGSSFSCYNRITSQICVFIICFNLCKTENKIYRVLNYGNITLILTVTGILIHSNMAEYAVILASSAKMLRRRESMQDRLTVRSKRTPENNQAQLLYWPCGGASPESTFFIIEVTSQS